MCETPGEPCGRYGNREQALNRVRFAYSRNAAAVTSHSLSGPGFDVLECRAGRRVVSVGHRHQILRLGLECVHRACCGSERLRTAVESLLELLEQLAVCPVEFLLSVSDGAAQGMVCQHGVGADRQDAVRVDHEGLTCGARLRCITAQVAASELQFLEPVVMRNLIAVGMEDVPVAVPDFATRGSLTLFDDFLQ